MPSKNIYPLRQLSSYAMDGGNKNGRTIRLLIMVALLAAILFSCDG